MISWHWFQSSHGTQWHFLPPFISCSVIILFLSKPRHFESKQHHTNTTLHVCFFSFCCEVFFFFLFFCVCCTSIKVLTAKIMDFFANGNEKNMLGRKDKEKGAAVDLRERLRPLKTEVLVFYRLEDQYNQHFPSGPSKRKTVEEKLLFWRSSANISIPELRMLNLLSEPAPRYQAFLL